MGGRGPSFYRQRGQGDSAPSDPLAGLGGGTGQERVGGRGEKGKREGK